MSDSIEVIVKHTVKSCRECHHAHNDAWDHDDPFTSSPVGYWTCLHGGFGIQYMPDGNTRFDISSGINPRCRLLKR